MFCHKKKQTREISEESDGPVDFIWIRYTGMNKLGFSYKQVGHMYFGLWADLFEIHKKQYNFETKRALYDIREEEAVSSLSVL